MAALLSLPVTQLPFTPKVASAAGQAPLRLPRVQRVARTAPLLHPGPLPGQSDFLVLNIAQGCAHRCAYCSARAYPSYPGDDVVYLFEDTAQRLRAELRARRQHPRAVLISPSTDPFMPLAQVQAETARVIEVLAEHGVGIRLMTRGFIRPSALEVVARHSKLIKVVAGITTLDRTLHRVLEPLAAPPRLRLRQIKHLRQLGIPVQVEVGPLIPDLTDRRDNLKPLLEALAAVEVKDVTTSYVFLRSTIRDHLRQALANWGWNGEEVLQEYQKGPVLEAGGLVAARYLPKARRQRGYTLLTALAAELGITVRISGLTNPDLAPTPSRRPLPRLSLFS